MNKINVFESILLILIWTLSSFSGLKAQSDGFPRGAYKMPYIRYEADKGLLGQGAVVRGPSMDQTKIESEASERIYVALPFQGSFVQWTIKEAENGMTIRFTLPDSSDGKGLDGTLSLYVNNVFLSDIKITSHFAYQYFYKTKGFDIDPHNNPVVGNPRMRFDEVRFIFPTQLKAGDILKLQKKWNDGLEYGIDFIELEPILPPIQKPVGFVDVTQPPFNAIPNDTIDDYNAINSAIEYAYKNNMGVYIPQGKFIIGNQIQLNNDNLRILGAGIWYTELHFNQTPTNATKGGIHGNASNLHVSDLYLTSELNYRGGYRAFGQYWGKNSIIENIWLTHFSVCFWIADYIHGKKPKIADGLIVRNCRVRNTYADGINLARGSSNCIVEHCSIRNTGDDAMASWASDSSNTGPTTFNTFRFNTVENTYRAAGLGFFGGQKHVAHHCIILDSFAGGGIRVNSTFAGVPFASDSYINISEMTVKRCGSSDSGLKAQVGGIDFNVRYYDVNNIKFNSIDLIDSQNDGILINDVTKTFLLHDVYFDDVNIVNTGNDQFGSGYGIYVSKNNTGWIQNTNVIFQNTASGNTFNASSTFQIKTINVANNKRPVAVADSVIYLANNQTSMVINGNKSYDPDGKSITYSWVQLAGLPAVLNGTQESSVNISGLNPNEEYIFKLSVKNGVLTGHKIIYVKPVRNNTNF